MARPAIRPTRRQFLKTSAAVAVGAGATRPFGAPALAQRPKLVYWCYQFLKSSDDARANFAQEWAKKNNVDLQISMVPLKEFLPKITAAIEAKATPDIIESDAAIVMPLLDPMLLFDVDDDRASVPPLTVVKPV